MAAIADLSITELLKGIASPTMSSHWPVLIGNLANKVSNDDEFKEEDLQALCLVVLNVALVSSAQNCLMCCALLANLTTNAKNVEIFLTLIVVPGKIKDAFSRCVVEFLSHNPQLEDPETVPAEGTDWGVLDRWQYMANVLCNICQHEDGRKFVLFPQSGRMALLVKQVQSRNTMRRKNSVAAIRSCLFDTAHQFWMLHEIKLMNYILPPLVTHESPFNEKEKAKLDPLIWMLADNPDKKLEPDIDIVMMLVECVLLCCQRRVLRDELRKLNVYLVIKNLATEVVDHDPICDKIQEIVDLLVRDESSHPADIAAEETALAEATKKAIEDAATIEAQAAATTTTADSDNDKDDGAPVGAAIASSSTKIEDDVAAGINTVD